MSKFLITPSLYNSFLYYAMTDFNSIWEDPEKAAEAERNAYQDWLDCLNKVKKPTTEVQQRGINFENAVYELTQGIERIEDINAEATAHGVTELPASNLLDDAEYATAQEIAEKVKGGLWQEVLTKDVGDYLLYGKSDVIRRDTIFDIKRVNSYEVGKYQKSIQHSIYMECSEIEHFEYLISNGKTVYSEYYHKEPNNLDRLIGKIDNMVNFIAGTPEFYRPFKQNWIARG